ncbi:MAG TPA: 4-alpha-glucanotransferase [Myxococcota bacterium]|nr:4-alpha-glucanotransferase [Myxococcota bacterium]
MGSMEKDRLSSIPSFPPHYRASGVLLHVTSLPSRYGVGDVGPTAMQRVDLLDDAGQSWWQSLPPGLAWSSTAGLAIAPLQDLLSLGAEARMNVPGQSGGNWAWRCPAGLLNGTYLESLSELTDETRRKVKGP